MTSLDEAKRVMRAAMLGARSGGETRAGASLRDHLLRDAAPASGAVVAGFWPMRDEIDLLPTLVALHERGHAVALPATPPRGQPLTFHRWRPGDAMRPEKFGTQRPAADDPLTPDFLFVPLLAFDRAGRRLGYGGGYYDRTLAALPGADWIGVAFAAQEVASVPAGPHDIRMKRVATERELLNCGHAC